MFQLRSRFYVDYSIKELIRSLINHTLNDETNRKEITKKLDNILTKDFNINDYLLYNYCRSAFKHILEFLKKKVPIGPSSLNRSLIFASLKKYALIKPFS